MEYQHIQYGYTWLLTALVLVPVAWFSLPEAFADSLWVGMLIFVFMVGVVAITVWFSRLAVSVTGREVRVVFGLGKPHRVIPLDQIVGTSSVRTKWYYGWGVRGVPGGWMYNVWGFDAVEVRLASDDVFWIGTDEPDRLEAAISLSPYR